ncbi:MAG: UDP-N-acetylmuramate--L-alanine ligase [Bacteroidales bacterium]
MNIHFIAIGGAVMHNLAIALKKQGHHVSGSDDEIFEPSKSRLKIHGILPEQPGWHPDNITKDVDAVILGMHARKDNPELIRAMQLGINIHSFPEFLYEQTKNKKRIVIAGSHGKTTITSMVMHVLKKQKMNFDYMVGAQIEGFNTMVGLSDDTDIAIFEGDEYLSSPLDKKPKILWYKPHAAVITGIAWDHANVFPTENTYINQFKTFINSIPDGGKLFYYKNDAILKNISDSNPDIQSIGYEAVNYENINGTMMVKTEYGDFPMSVFGDHNAQNIEASKLLCAEAGVDDRQFYIAIQDFKGAARRMQLLAENKNTSVYLDFAHAPSKVKATTKAMKARYPKRKLVACLELHTFSSLNQQFLPQYAGTLSEADHAFVYFNPRVVKHKNLPEINKKFVKQAFDSDIMVFTDADQMMNKLLNVAEKNCTVLIMTSGNLDGRDIQSLANIITDKSKS